MVRENMRSLFADPGYSLLRNPFGDFDCYFLGVFYPCNPTQALISLQTEVLGRLSLEGPALMFESDCVGTTEIVDGDIADALNQKILDSDQLVDLNLYFEKTMSGVCISQEESLMFCASMDSECKDYLDAITAKYISEISESVDPIKKHVKLLSGAIPPFFR